MLAKWFCVLFLLYEAQCFKYFNTYIENHNIENAEAMFEEFLEATGMNFTGDKYYERLTVFTDNLKRINNMNAKHSSAQFGITEWSHLTLEEFRNVTRCLGKREETPATADVERIVSDDDGDDDDSKDWRDKLPPIKDQMYCTSCWIFSGVGAIEAQYAILNNKVISLSEQEVLDCTTDRCDIGGYMSDVFKYVKRFGGIMAEKDYPYIGEPDKTCSDNISKVVAKVTGYTSETAWSESDMKNYVKKTGPISIALDDSMLAFYIKGILDPGPHECTGEINHAVLIVGYSNEEKPHWIVRNSWGETKGEKGYFRIVRNKNACLIATAVATVTVEKN